MSPILRERGAAAQLGEGDEVVERPICLIHRRHRPVRVVERLLKLNRARRWDWLLERALVQHRVVVVHCAPRLHRFPRLVHLELRQLARRLLLLLRRLAVERQQRVERCWPIPRRLAREGVVKVARAARIVQDFSPRHRFLICFLRTLLAWHAAVSAWLPVNVHLVPEIFKNNFHEERFPVMLA